MQYSACLNPQRIYNKYVKRWVTVPCGHCDACIIARSMPSVQRLNAEREQWFDCLFFTLTYTDEFIPRLTKTKSLFVHNLDLDVKTGSNKFVYQKDFVEDKRFLDYYMNELGFIPVLSREDIKNYIKSLKTAFKDYGDFKICICTEYGPSSFRAHAHGLFFYNHRTIGRQIETDTAAALLRQNWSTAIRGQSDESNKLGNVDVQYVESGANTYVAQYLHCTTHLPKILRYFAPFKIQSRGIGTNNISPQQIRESFFVANGLVLQPTDATTTSPQYNLLSSSIYLRLFPKLRSYNRIDAASFESLVVYANTFATAKEFREHFAYIRNRDRTLDKSFLNWPIEDVILNIFSEDYVSDSQLDSFYYALRKCIKVSHQFGVSLQFYIDRYRQFYSSLELLKLKNFYELQIEIANDPLVESEFINGLYTDFDINSPAAEVLGLDYFMPYQCDISKLRHFMTLKNCPLFRKFELKMKKIVGDTTKTKHANESKNSKRAHDLNQILFDVDLKNNY